MAQSKRILAFVMAMVLMFSALPVSAWAEGSENTQTTADTESTETTEVTEEVTGNEGIASIAAETASMKILSDQATITYTVYADSGVAGFEEWTADEEYYYYYDNTSSNSVQDTITITNNTENSNLSIGYSFSGISGLTITGDGVTATDTECKIGAGKSAVFTFSVNADTYGELYLNDPTLAEITDSGVRFEYQSYYGSVAVGGTDVASGGSVDITADGATMVATTKNGSSFLGWINADTGELISSEASYAYKPTGDVTVKAAFAHKDAPAWFRASGVYYTDNLDDASDYAANQTNKTIVLLASGTLSGTHTIDSGVTLHVPYDASYSEPENRVQPTVEGITKKTEWVAFIPVTKYTFVLKSIEESDPFRTLTLKTGAKLTVAGELLVNSAIFASGARDTTTPHGAYGLMVLENGAEVIVNGGTVYCYGFIIGTYDSQGNYTGGKVTAQSGTVYELFQVRDMAGTDASLYGEEIEAFPMTQYYVQNIEAQYVIHSGAISKAVLAAANSDSPLYADFTFIGKNDGLFRVESGTLNRLYHPMTDRVEYTANGTMSLSAMVVSLMGNTMNSANYNLALNGNISINIASGFAKISQRVKLLPGAGVYVGEDATLTVEDGTGTLVLFDKEHWITNFAYYPASTDTTSQNTLKTVTVTFNNAGTKADVVRYSPSRERVKGTITAASHDSAKLHVDGILEAYENVYSTAGYTVPNGTEQTGTAYDNFITGTGQFINNSSSNTVTSGISSVNEIYNHTEDSCATVRVQPLLGMIVPDGSQTLPTDLTSFGVTETNKPYNGFWADVDSDTVAEKTEYMWTTGEMVTVEMWHNGAKVDSWDTIVYTGMDMTGYYTESSCASGTEATSSFSGTTLYVPAVASILRGTDTIYYQYLTVAVEDAQPGETVNLLRDTTLKSPLIIDSDQRMTLNLNNHSVSYCGVTGAGAVLTNNGILSINGGDVNVATPGKLINTNDTADDYGYGIINNGTIKTLGGYLEVHSSNSVLQVNSGSVVNTIGGENAKVALYQDNANTVVGTAGSKYAVHVNGGTINTIGGPNANVTIKHINKAGQHAATVFIDGGGNVANIGGTNAVVSIIQDDQDTTTGKYRNAIWVNNGSITTLGCGGTVNIISNAYGIYMGGSSIHSYIDNVATTGTVNITGLVVDGVQQPCATGIRINQTIHTNDIGVLGVGGTLNIYAKNNGIWLGHADSDINIIGQGGEVNITAQEVGIYLEKSGAHVETIGAGGTVTIDSDDIGIDMASGTRIETIGLGGKVEIDSDDKVIYVQSGATLGVLGGANGHVILTQNAATSDDPYAVQVDGTINTIGDTNALVEIDQYSESTQDNGNGKILYVKGTVNNIGTASGSKVLMEQTMLLSGDCGWGLDVRGGKIGTIGSDNSLVEVIAGHAPVYLSGTIEHITGNTVLVGKQNWSSPALWMATGKTIDSITGGYFGQDGITNGAQVSDIFDQNNQNKIATAGYLISGTTVPVTSLANNRVYNCYYVYSDHTHEYDGDAIFVWYKGDGTFSATAAQQCSVEGCLARGESVEADVTSKMVQVGETNSYTVTYTATAELGSASYSEERNVTYAVDDVRSRYYDDRLTGSNIQLWYAGQPTSKKVGSNELDNAVLTLVNGKLIATGVGSAIASIDGVTYKIDITAAPISLFITTGHSVGMGSKGEPEESIVCEDGQVYSYNVTNHNTNGYDASRLMADEYVTSDMGLGYASAKRPLNVDALTKAGGGLQGEDSAIAWKWNKETREKVYIVNAAVGGTCLYNWAEDDNISSSPKKLLSSAVKQFKQAQKILAQEVAAGHYVMRDMALIYHNGANFSYRDIKYNDRAGEQWYEEFIGEMRDAVDTDLYNKPLSVGYIPIWTRAKDTATKYCNASFDDDKPASMYMGASADYPDMFTASLIGWDQWRTDDMVAAYFDGYEQEYITQNGETLPVPSANYQLYPYERSDYVHYNQFAYNEMGLDIAKNLIAYFRGAPVAENQVTLRLLRTDGTTAITNGQTFEMVYGDRLTLVPVVTPITVNDLTIETSGNVRIEYPLTITPTGEGTGSVTIKYGNTELITVNITATGGTENVAKIEETQVEYKSLQDAIDAAENGQTVVLLKDASQSNGCIVPNGKTITLNLNNHTFTTTGTSATAIRNFGVLTVSGGVLGDDKTPGKIVHANGYGIENYGTLTKVGGYLTIESVNSGSSIYTYYTYNTKGNIGTIGGADSNVTLNAKSYGVYVANDATVDTIGGDGTVTINASTGIYVVSDTKGSTIGTVGATGNNSVTINATYGITVTGVKAKIQYLGGENGKLEVNSTSTAIQVLSGAKIDTIGGTGADVTITHNNTATEGVIKSVYVAGENSRIETIGGTDAKVTIQMKDPKPSGTRIAIWAYNKGSIGTLGSGGDVKIICPRIGIFTASGSRGGTSATTEAWIEKIGTAGKVTIDASEPFVLYGNDKRQAIDTIGAGGEVLIKSKLIAIELIYFNTKIGTIGAAGTVTIEAGTEAIKLYGSNSSIGTLGGGGTVNIDAGTLGINLVGSGANIGTIGAGGTVNVTSVQNALKLATGTTVDVLGDANSTITLHQDNTGGSSSNDTKYAVYTFGKITRIGGTNANITLSQTNNIAQYSATVFLGTGGRIDTIGGEGATINIVQHNLSTQQDYQCAIWPSTGSIGTLGSAGTVNVYSNELGLYIGGSSSAGYVETIGAAGTVNICDIEDGVQIPGKVAIRVGGSPKDYEIGEIAKPGSTVNITADSAGIQLSSPATAVKTIGAGGTVNISGAGAAVHVTKGGNIYRIGDTNATVNLSSTGAETVHLENGSIGTIGFGGKVTVNAVQTGLYVGSGAVVDVIGGTDDTDGTAGTVNFIKNTEEVGSGSNIEVVGTVNTIGKGGTVTLSWNGTVDSESEAVPYALYVNGGTIGKLGGMDSDVAVSTNICVAAINIDNNGKINFIGDRNAEVEITNECQTGNTAALRILNGHIGVIGGENADITISHTKTSNYSYAVWLGNNTSGTPGSIGTIGSTGEHGMVTLEAANRGIVLFAGTESKIDYLGGDSGKVEINAGASALMVLAGSTVDIIGGENSQVTITGTGNIEAAITVSGTINTIGYGSKSLVEVTSVHRSIQVNSGGKIRTIGGKNSNVNITENAGTKDNSAIIYVEGSIEKIGDENAVVKIKQNFSHTANAQGIVVRGSSASIVTIGGKNATVVIEQDAPYNYGFMLRAEKGATIGTIGGSEAKRVELIGAYFALYTDASSKVLEIGEKALLVAKKYGSSYSVIWNAGSIEKISGGYYCNVGKNDPIYIFQKKDLSEEKNTGTMEAITNSGLAVSTYTVPVKSQSTDEPTTYMCYFLTPTDATSSILYDAISVNVEGETILNLKFHIPDSYLTADYTVTVTEEKNTIVPNGNEWTVSLAELASLTPGDKLDGYEVKMDNNGRYVFSQGIASGEMTGDVTVTFKKTDGTVVKVYDSNSEQADKLENSIVRTVVDFAELALENGSDELKALTTAMLSYGGYAQNFFGVDTENLASVILTEEQKATVDIEDVTQESFDATVTTKGALSGVLPSQIMLDLDSKTTMRVYFTLSNNRTTEGLSVSLAYPVDGKLQNMPLTIHETNDGFYVEVEDIAVAYWDHNYEITITHTDGTMVVTSSVMSWVKNCIKSNINETEVAMAKAMYYYNQAANAYFGK